MQCLNYNTRIVVLVKKHDLFGRRPGAEAVPGRSRPESRARASADVRSCRFRGPPGSATLPLVPVIRRPAFHPVPGLGHRRYLPGFVGWTKLQGGSFHASRVRWRFRRRGVDDGRGGCTGRVPGHLDRSHEKKVTVTKFGDLVTVTFSPAFPGPVSDGAPARENRGSRATGRACGRSVRCRQGCGRMPWSPGPPRR